MSKTEISMLSGNPYKLIIKFAIPLIIGNVFQQLYNAVDTYVVGKYLGDKAIAAVGAGFPFLLMMVSIFMGIGMASTVIISQYYGEGNYEKLGDTVTTTYIANIIIGVPMTVIGVLISKKVLLYVNVPDDGTLDMAGTYLTILFLGIIGSVGYNTNAGILQGLGDSRSSLLFLIIATITNIILDVLFVGPLGMGIAGAAIATIISQLFSWILGIFYINKHFEYFNMHFLKLKFDKKIFMRTIKLGAPISIQNAVFSFGVIVMLNLITSYGSAFMAGYTAANKLDFIIFFSIQSIANAVTTFTGQNYGAKNVQRINAGLKAGMNISVITAIVEAIIMLQFAKPLLKLFVTGQEAVAAGMAYINQVVPFYFIIAVLFSVNSVLRGMGITMVPMFTTLLSLWLARVPMAYLIAARFGKYNIFYSYPIGWAIGVIVSGSYYLSGRWKKKLDL